MSKFDGWSGNNFKLFKHQVEKLLGQKYPESLKCLMELATLDKFMYDMKNNHQEM